jgi:electron transport complex protein RnfB
VPVDPLVERVRDRLPGANCGAWGFAGCQAFAEAVVARADVSPSLCIPGRAPVSEAVAELTSKAGDVVADRIVVMSCHGTSAYARDEAQYAGIDTCAAAALVFGGPKACKNGCLGLGDCVRACPFDALSIRDGGIAQVDTAACTGCGVCVPVCPKDLFKFVPRARRIELACRAVDKQAIVRSTCLVGCTLCRKCVAKCPAGAITWDGRTILIDHEKCIAYGPSCQEACSDICPSVILHRVGSSPRPELVAISEPTGV